MDALDLSVLLDGAVSARSSTSFSVDVGGGDLTTFTGESFSYSGPGLPVDGTITSISDSHSGQLTYTLTQVSIPVVTFNAWLQGTDPYAPFQAVFAGPDTMTASNTAASSFVSYGGADLLTGGPYADALIGGAGDNTLLGGDGNDTLMGDGPGSNFIRGGTGADLIWGAAGNDNINGNQGDDTITGGAGGVDWLLGGQGDDRISGSINGIINGNLGNDTIAGGTLNDTIRGGQGNDSIDASGGDDVIFGDLGDDTIDGGAGSDTYRVSPGSGHDIILFFGNGGGTDHIQLDPGMTYTKAQAADGVVLTFNTGDTITLRGMFLANFNDSWVVAT